MKEAIIAEVLKRLPREEYIEDEEGIDEWWEDVVYRLYDAIYEELYSRGLIKDES